MNRKFQPRLQCIQSTIGKKLTEAAQIADGWKRYCEDLYYDKEGNRVEREYWEQEPPLLRSEVALAIHQTASRKATGPDEVPAELFKVTITITPFMFRSHYVLQEYIRLVCVNADDFFEFRVSNTRGHSYKLYQQFSNCTSRSACR